MNKLKTDLIYHYIVFTFVQTALAVGLYGLLFAGAPALEAKTGIPETVFGCVGLLLMLLLLAGFSFAYYHKVSQAIAAETARRVRERNLLFANIAHDLKNPMASILGYARALESGNVSSAEQDAVCRTISAKALQVDDMVQKLFRYAKLETEGYTLALRDGDVCALVRECAALRYGDMEATGAEPEICIPDEPVLCSVDAPELTRVVDNLISNALRHNEPGIRLLVAVDVRKNDVEILVADSGNPIPAGMKNTLFEPFQCSDESRTAKDGSGLGLAIARRIVQLHGGELRLREDVPGYTKGFAASLPLGKAE